MQIRIDLKIFAFVLLFLITNQLKIYVYLMIFALLHEIGHTISGILLGFKIQNFEIMPMGFSIKFHVDTNNYNKKILNSNLLVIKTYYSNKWASC